MPRTQHADYRDAERSESSHVCFCYIFKHGDDLFHVVRWDKAVYVTGLPATRGDDPQSFFAGQIEHQNADDESVEFETTQMTVMMALADTPGAQDLRRYFIEATEKEITLEVFRVNTDLLGDASPSVGYGVNTETEFYGDCINISFVENRMQMQFQSKTADEKNPLPQHVYQKNCQHQLGGPFCQANLETAANRLVTTVLALDRPKRSITIADTLLNGGAITAKTFEMGKVYELDGPGGATVNKITVISTEVLPASAGIRLRVAWLPPTLIAGRNIKLYRGCNRTPAACVTFGVLANYGGFPYIPISNPSIDGVSV